MLTNEPKLWRKAVNNNYGCSRCMPFDDFVYDAWNYHTPNGCFILFMQFKTNMRLSHVYKLIYILEIYLATIDLPIHII